MKAMIMAAGRGTRLGSITEKTPKALVEINGKSMLRIAVERCFRYGFDEIIVNIHHFADMVEEEVEQLKKTGYRVQVSDERAMLLENGGGLFKARAFFDSKPFLVCNVDIVTDLDLGLLYQHHLSYGGLATLVVRNRTDDKYLLIDSHSILRGWCNVKTGEKIVAGKETDKYLTKIAFSSYQIIDPDCFNYMTEGVYTLVKLYLDLAETHKIVTYTCNDGYWFDIGTPENLESVRKFMADKQGI